MKRVFITYCIYVIGCVFICLFVFTTHDFDVSFRVAAFFFFVPHTTSLCAVHNIQMNHCSQTNTYKTKFLVSVVRYKLTNIVINHVFAVFYLRSFLLLLISLSFTHLPTNVVVFFFTVYDLLSQCFMCGKCKRISFFFTLKLLLNSKKLKYIICTCTCIQLNGVHFNFNNKLLQCFLFH